MYPIISILGREVGSYALFSFIGLFACGAVLYAVTRREKIPFEDIMLLLLVTAGGLLVGGHALYTLTNLPRLPLFIQAIRNGSLTVWQAIMQLGGGMVFYGGFLGGFAALALYRKKAPSNLAIFDLYAISTPLFHLFGRLGCFFAGCCYGIESSVGFIVENNSLMPAICGVRRFPVALLEAGCNGLIFLVLLLCLRRRKHTGKLLYGYMLLYPSVRFCTEFLRGDAVRGIWWGLSTSQWISLFLFGYTIAHLWLNRKKSSL